MIRRVRPLKRASDLEERLWMTLDEAVPPVVRTHLRSAGKEVLLAIRAMLDHAIEQAGTPAQPRRPRRVRVQ
jgi:hypothetical protein